MVTFGVTIFTVALIWGITTRQTRPSVAKRVFGVAFFALSDLAIAATGYRAVRTGVVADQNKIVVRNFWYSKEVAWGDIDRFAVEPNGAYTIGYVHLRDGTGIATWGIQGQMQFLSKNGGWTGGPIDTLNRLLAEHRTGAAA
jgi:hypothetical protein